MYSYLIIVRYYHDALYLRDLLLLSLFFVSEKVAYPY